MAGTILMVDDDLALLDLYEAVLETDYTVLLADNVKQAIEILSAQHVDAVGCDFHLGLEKGLDVLNWIDRNKPDLLKRSVLISGESLNNVVGLDVKIVLKPVQVSELDEIFHQFLGEGNRAE